MFPQLKFGGNGIAKVTAWYVIYFVTDKKDLLKFEIYFFFLIANFEEKN